MPSWIRGVNLGGWLVLERFITPYLFAITTCHLQGNFCYYPGQMDAPPREDPSYRECDLKTCRPVLLKSPITGELDYPVDEYSLLKLFDDPLIASKFMDLHYQHFVTRQDIRNLKEAGITHVRVPLPHWILTPSSLEAEEPWVSDNNAWLYFLRLVGWCRQDGIEVWPDLHTAPGMQNGVMSNSAQVDEEGVDVDDADDDDDDDSTCARWNVNRTLAALQSICNEIAKDGLTDVVTGFGILNEPVSDCDLQVVRDYSERALTIVLSTLGNDTSIHVGDMFNSTLWNDGWWESNPNTYLDSHYYHGTQIFVCVCVYIYMLFGRRNCGYSNLVLYSVCARNEAHESTTAYCLCM
jgi:glucan 1,3-beta-glucosidase